MFTQINNMLLTEETANELRAIVSLLNKVLVCLIILVVGSFVEIVRISKSVNKQSTSVEGWNQIDTSTEEELGTKVEVEICSEEECVYKYEVVYSNNFYTAQEQLLEGRHIDDIMDDIALLPTDLDELIRIGKEYNLNHLFS